MRSSIAEIMNMSITPELVFELDESLIYVERIDRILERV